jgi:hypothetical protein
VAALSVAVLVLAGCGSSSKHSGSGAVTVPAYGVYASSTVPGSTASGAGHCRATAQRFAGGTLMFLAHVRPHGAYPSDIYYFLLRERLASFNAHRCDVKLLGSAVAHTLTTSQRRTLLAALPGTMAATLRKALDRAGS